MHYPKFAILLAAHNGMQWIADQVQSILKQENVNLHIFISIDASTDNTLPWCLSLAEQDSRVTALPSENRFGGAAKNFFHLIREVDFQNFDYIAFADQDDIWLSDKLVVAHETIISRNYAAYSSNVTAFWENGRQTLIHKAQPQRKYDFLFEAAGPGCSYVLRTTDALQFKEFLIKHWESVNEISLHDWFIYAWFRSHHLPWYIDVTPKVLYRQHNHNQVGANQGANAIFKRLKMIRFGWYYAEVNKIWNLVGYNLEGQQPTRLHPKIVTRNFIIRHFWQIRRRFRDRLFLFAMALLGLY